MMSCMSELYCGTAFAHTDSDMRRLSSFLLCLCLPIAAAACGSSSTSPSTTADSTTGYRLSGTLAAAVSGVPQKSTHVFLLSAGATVTVTLTSAVETLLDGTTTSTINVGVGLGTMSNGTCTVLPGAFVNTASATAANMAWTMPAGTNCVEVSDVTVLEGPVAYAITLTY